MGGAAEATLAVSMDGNAGADTDAALWNLIHSHKTVQVISMVAAATKEGRELWDGGLGPRGAPRFGLYDRWTWLE